MDVIHPIMTVLRGVYLSTTHTHIQKVQILQIYVPRFVSNIQNAAPHHFLPTTLHLFRDMIISWKTNTFQTTTIFAAVATTFLRLLAQVRPEIFDVAWFHQSWQQPQHNDNNNNNINTSTEILKRIEDTLSVLKLVLPALSRTGHQTELAREVYYRCQPLLTIQSQEALTKSSTLRNGCAAVLLYAPQPCWNEQISNRILQLGPDWAYQSESTEEMEMMVQLCQRAWNSGLTTHVATRATVSALYMLTLLGEHTQPKTTNGLCAIFLSMPYSVREAVGTAVEERSLMYSCSALSNVILALSTWPMRTARAGAWLETILEALLRGKRYDALVLAGPKAVPNLLKTLTMSITSQGNNPCHGVWGPLEMLALGHPHAQLLHDAVPCFTLLLEHWCSYPPNNTTSLSHDQCGRCLAFIQSWLTLNVPETQARGLPLTATTTTNSSLFPQQQQTSLQALEELWRETSTRTGCPPQNAVDLLRTGRVRAFLPHICCIVSPFW